MKKKNYQGMTYDLINDYISKLEISALSMPISDKSKNNTLRELSELLYDPESLENSDMSFAPGMTLLHYVAAKGYARTVSILIKIKGVDVNLIDGNGNSALSYASFGEVGRVLRSYGAKKISQMTEEEFSEYNANEESRGTTIIDCISKMNPAELNKPIDELFSDGLTDKTLIELYNALNSEIALDDIGGMTLLHYASAKGYKEVIDELIDNKGMDVNLMDKNGNTPFDCAAISVARDLKLKGAKTSDDVIAETEEQDQGSKRLVSHKKGELLGDIESPVNEKSVRSKNNDKGIGA